MKRQRIKIGLVLATLVGVWAVRAGSLEPPGAPAPTMKPLSAVQGAWSELLTSSRFELVMNGDAVLDHESGLVWELAPSEGNWWWFLAVLHCYDLDKGGRKGWRLPAIEELGTLIDTAQTTPPLLPPGHPFLGLGSDPADAYWSMTNYPAYQAKEALALSLVSGSPGPRDKETGYGRVWCVRAGLGQNPYPVPPFP